DATPTSLGADDQPQRRGDVFGTIDQGGACGGFDPVMLHDLPGHDQRPPGEQQPVNQLGSSGHVSVQGQENRRGFGRSTSGSDSAGRGPSWKKRPASRR